MKTQSETTKPVTPLRRIPKNRGTVVKNVNELNPLSEKEIKNVIEVYSEANKAYYVNRMKNEKKKKIKKKKTIKKTLSEEFNPLSLNPLDYRNKNFEENGALMHLPGSNISPKYTPDNLNSEYGVSSMSYKTLHNSKPISWGCDYKKHYELPTICSIVKSKHPIYSKPNTKKGKKYIDNPKTKTKNKNKKNEEANKNSENLTLNKVPTFGDYKEYDVSDFSEENKNKNNQNFSENNNQIGITINSNLDTFKESLIISNSCSDYNGESINSVNSYRLVKGVNQIAEKSDNNSNLPIKREDNNAENKNKVTDNIEEKECNAHNNNKLNLKCNTNKNNISIYSNHSVDNSLSNSTLTELKLVNIESNNSCEQKIHCNYNTFEYSNSTCNNSKSPCRNLHCTSSYNEDKQKVYYWNSDKHKNRISSNSPKKNLKPKPEIKISTELYRSHGNCCDHSERESEKGSKKLSIKYKNYSKMQEKKHKNDNKGKHKERNFRKNKYMKNEMNDETNSSIESFYNKRKKKSNKNNVKSRYSSRRDKIDSNNIINYIPNKDNSFKLNSENSIMSNLSNSVQSHFLEPNDMNSKISHNIISSNPMVQKPVEIQKNKMYKTENLPNKQLYMQSEINYTQGNIPINNMQAQYETKMPASEVQVYAPFDLTNILETQSMMHNMQAQEPQRHQIQSELTHIQSHIPIHDTGIYGSNSQLAHMQTNVIKTQNKCQIQDQIQSPMQNPVQSPIQTTIQTPMRNTIHTSMQDSVYAPIQTIMQNPIQNIMKTTVQTPMQNPIQTQIQTTVQSPITNIETQISQIKSEISHLKSQMSQEQNQISQIHAQPSLIKSPLCLEGAQPSHIQTNLDLRMPNELCSSMELQKPRVKFKNFNNGNDLCGINSVDRYNSQNCFLKPFNPNNNSYNTILNNRNEFKSNQYIENTSVNPLIKCNTNLNDMNTDNTNVNNIGQVKTFDATINYLKPENDVPCWLKSYIDLQNTNTKKEFSNLSYLNIDFNNEKKNINYNMHASEVAPIHSNFQLINNNIYKSNNYNLELNKKNVNKIDVSQLIKTSNETLIDFQNKQLLNILNEKGTGQSNTPQNVAYNGNTSFHMHMKTDSNGNSQNFIDSTYKPFSYMNCANQSYYTQGFENKPSNIMIPSIPSELGIKKEFVQNNVNYMECLN